MKYACAITFLLGALVYTAGAEEFYLKHDVTGKTYGPFESDAGAKVALETASFTVIQTNAQVSRAEQALERVRIPEIDFRSASLHDAVDFLKIQVRELDPNRAPINFVLVSPRPPKPIDDDPFAPVLGRAFERHPTVTLNLRGVSALQVLKSMMDQTGYRYKVSGNIITLYPDE